MVESRFFCCVLVFVMIVKIELDESFLVVIDVVFVYLFWVMVELMVVVF